MHCELERHMQSNRLQQVPVQTHQAHAQHPPSRHCSSEAAGDSVAWPCPDQLPDKPSSQPASVTRTPQVSHLSHTRWLAGSPALWLTVALSHCHTVCHTTIIIGRWLTVTRTHCLSCTLAQCLSVLLSLYLTRSLSHSLSLPGHPRRITVTRTHCLTCTQAHCLHWLTCTQAHCLHWLTCLLSQLLTLPYTC